MSMMFYEPGDTVYYPIWDVATSKVLSVSDRKINVYPSGKLYTRYLFDNLLDTLVQEMHENVADDLDNVICVWGAEGSGKSNLAYWIAKKYNPEFDMERSYVLSFEDLLTRIHEYDGESEGAIFWMDEATNIGNNRDWMHTDNKQFITMLEMFRSKKWCLILCIPDYNRLDVYLREHRIRYSLHAEILDWEHHAEKKRGYFELTRMDYKNSSGYRHLQKVGYGKFDRIPPEDAELYHTIKDRTQESKLTELYDERNKKTRFQEMARNMRKAMLEDYEGGLSYEQIGTKYNYTASTIKGYLSQARKERESS